MTLSWDEQHLGVLSSSTQTGEKKDTANQDATALDYSFKFFDVLSFGKRHVLIIPLLFMYRYDVYAKSRIEASCLRICA